MNDMLDLAKMENGTYTPKREVIDPVELCRKAAALQSPRMRPGVQMILTFPDPGFSMSAPISTKSIMTPKQANNKPDTTTQNLPLDTHEALTSQNKSRMMTVRLHRGHGCCIMCTATNPKTNQTRHDTKAVQQ